MITELESNKKLNLGKPTLDGEMVVAFTREKDRKVFKIGEWVSASDYFCLIGKIKSIRKDGYVVFENVSPTGNDIERYVNNIEHISTPYTTAYNTDAGYGSSGGDKTRGSYPYFKQMIDKGFK